MRQGNTTSSEPRLLKPYQQAQREAEHRSRLGFHPQLVKHRNGAKLLRSASGDLYARNSRGDLLKVSKRLTGRAARWYTRISERVTRALPAYDAMFQQSEPEAQP